MANFTVVQRQLHTGRKWMRPEHLTFAMTAATVPLVGTELLKVVPSAPVAFVAHNNSFQLVAVLSLIAGKNMFIGPNGNWLVGYVPAMFRSYPFKMLRPHGAEEPLLCIDEDSGLISQTGAGEDFFDADGAVSPALQGVANFLSEIFRCQLATDLAVASLQQAGVIVPWRINIQSGQGPRVIEGLYRIDEAALNNLAEGVFIKLRATGALAIAYGQLFSMEQLSVFQTLSKIQAQLAPKPMAPLPDSLDKLFDLSDNTHIRFD